MSSLNLTSRLSFEPRFRMFIIITVTTQKENAYSPWTPCLLLCICILDFYFVFSYFLSENKTDIIMKLCSISNEYPKHTPTKLGRK